MSLPPLGSPPPSSQGARRRTRITVDDMRAWLAGGLTPERAVELRGQLDHSGLNLPQKAALMAATQTDALLPLLDLLEPKGGEVSKVDAILDLLMAQAEALGRIERRLDALERRQALRVVRSHAG